MQFSLACILFDPMKIYINDIPVRISEKRRDKKYDLIVNSHDDLIQIDKLKGRVLIEHKSSASIDHLLKIMTEKKHKKVKSIDIIPNSKTKAVKYLFTKFDVIQAAGGVVEKEDKILMILRNGLWDIPKGKLDKGEKKREAAVREVEEETGAKVEIKEKICSTWHTYIRNKKYVLKNTHWYRMSCLDDSKLKPQKSENIEKVVWLSESETDLVVHHTYKTIQRLINKYRKAAGMAAG